jgi:excinuclease UvrABC nuclease subunit
MAPTVSWCGYKFNVHEANVEFLDIGGIYIFAGVTEQKLWIPLYIGQASSLAKRLSGHERWASAAMHGATYIHAMAVPNESERFLIEKKLIQLYQPKLNSQLK